MYIAVAGIVVIALAIWGAQTYKIFPFNTTPPVTTTSDTTNTETPTAEPTNNPSLTYTLNFGTTSILLRRAANGNVSETFWNTTPKTVSVNGDLTSLYNAEDWWKFLYYDAPKQAYYELEPGGNEKLSFVNEQYIQKKITQTNVTVEDLTQTKSQTLCTGKKVTLNNIAGVWSVSCTNTTTDIATKDVLDANTITECYVPVTGSANYLAYEVPVLPAGSTLNLCDTIQGMKINSISKQ